ncbi:hypothetical protein [Pseudarthrobacter sp. AB1]|uniref:hypothetical protein n=1 Tax=Pseudarthrobacter sp. AB1 TaxID=2138309 RepID=UPI00186B848F|nr:hypothetical protein [Pseudarthrobacter sp. AB1]
MELETEMGLEVDEIRLGVIVVNYFSSSQVKQFLDSLVAVDSGCETYVCVVDNSCDNEEFNRLERSLKDMPPGLAGFEIVRSTVNAGYGRGNNLGWDSLKVHSLEVVVIANPDVILSGDLSSAMRRVRDNRDTLFATPTRHGARNLSGLGAVSFVTGKSRQLTEGAKLPKFSLTYPGGHFLAVAAGTWERLEGFSSDFFLYGEEADLTLRMRKIEPVSKVQVLSDIFVSHSGGLTTGSEEGRRKSEITYRHGTRSAIVLFRKHRILRFWWPSIVGIRLIFALSTWLKNGRRSGTAVFLGILDGIRWRPTGGVIN